MILFVEAARTGQPLFLFMEPEPAVLPGFTLPLFVFAFHYQIDNKQYESNKDHHSEAVLFHWVILFMILSL